MATVVESNVGSSVVAKEIVSHELDNAPKSFYAPIYKWRKLIQMSSGSTLTLGSGTTNSIFNIPGGSQAVYNLSKSYLMFDLSIASTGGAALWNSIHTDQIPLNDITLQTQTGQIVANLINVQPYTKTASLMCTELKEFLTRESVQVGTTIANGLQTQNQFCQPAKIAYFHPAGTSFTGVLNWGATVGAAAALLSGAGGVTAGALAATAAIGVPLTSIALTANAVSNQYIVSDGTVSAIPATTGSGCNDNNTPQRFATGTANSVNVVRCKVPFSMFVGTVLAMDKNVAWGQNMQLVLNWSQISKWGFVSAANGTTNLATLGAMTFSNYYLYLAQEVCAPNVDLAMAALNRGDMLIVPYTNCPKLAIGSAGLNTMNTPLVTGFGALKRVLTCCVSNTDNLSLNSNNDNVIAAGTGAYYSQVQSFLNNQPLQDYQLNVSLNEDYNYIFNLIKNSPAGLSHRNYQINSFWVDNFSDSSNSCDFPENDCLDSGRSIDNVENYSITYNIVPNSAVIYQFCTFARRLQITPNSISWK